MPTTTATKKPIAKNPATKKPATKSSPKLNQLANWTKQIAAGLAFSGITFGSVIGATWLATSWVDAQVARNVAGLEKKSDDVGEELKELRQLNLQLAQIILLSKEKSKP